MNYDIERQHFAALTEVDALAGKMNPQRRIEELEDETAALWQHLHAFARELEKCQYDDSPICRAIEDVLDRFLPGLRGELDEDTLRRLITPD